MVHTISTKTKKFRPKPAIPPPFVLPPPRLLPFHLYYGIIPTRSPAIVAVKEGAKNEQINSTF